MLKHLAPILLLVIMSCSVEPDNYDSAGNPIYYESLSGRYLLINYWAEWCHPCLEEIPELNLLANEYREDIAVIGVNFDGLDAEEISLQQELLGIKFPVLITDPAIYFSYDPPEVLPTSYLFDPNQQLIATLVGPQTSESILALFKTSEGTD